MYVKQIKSLFVVKDFNLLQTYKGQEGIKNRGEKN